MGQTLSQGENLVRIAGASSRIAGRYKPPQGRPLRKAGTPALPASCTLPSPGNWPCLLSSQQQGSNPIDDPSEG
jgi:hypothetical protein